MTENGSTLLKAGTDVAIILPDDQSFPGRVSRVLKDGKEISEIEWVGAGEGVEVELSDGRIVPTGVVVPGPHTCWHCDAQLTEGPVGVFTCTCSDWKSNQLPSTL